MSFRTILAACGLLAATSAFALTDEEQMMMRRAQRCVEAHSVKSAVAQFNEEVPFRNQGANGDEQRYADLRGSFGKGLAHQSNGYINNAAFDALVFALQTNAPGSFDAIPLGGPEGRLINPQACFAFSLAGNDGWVHTMPPAPAFESVETAGEMVELYWTVLVRDVPFNQFGTNATVAAAVNNLNQLSDFRGPKVNGSVTPGTFLRGNTPGDLEGPYVSQFFYQTIPYGATEVGPEQRVPVAGPVNNFNTTFPDWFATITGNPTGNFTTFDPNKHLIRTPRDLAEYVHVDPPALEATNALYLLLSYGNEALDPANPYVNNPTQESFVTYGVAEFQGLVGSVMFEALKTAWFQKWQVHRRCRPEEYGFYLQQQLVEGQQLGINAELTGSPALTQIHAAYQSYFLPQAYPEGSPRHPSYPAGHAVNIGSAVTLLKALFNEDYVIPNPLQPDAANANLVPYNGALTVGGELNKLAANVALGRDHAGVHYRSDGLQGMLLGEKIAIDVLNNTSFLLNEDFAGFTLTKFDGTTITVGRKRNP